MLIWPVKLVVLPQCEQNLGRENFKEGNVKGKQTQDGIIEWRRGLAVRSTEVGTFQEAWKV